MTAGLLLDAIERDRDAMVELTRRLIAIPTENPPGNCYPEAARAILQTLCEFGFDDVRAEGDCVLGFMGGGEPTLYFSGHYDVVPAQSPAQFEPEIAGANLFGRGSSDMKSGLAAMIYAAKALRESGMRLAGRVGLVFVPDEETAGSRGSRELAARGLLGRNAIGMLTPEPTGGVVWNANRGAITLKVTVRGKTAHVGRQFEGVNSFERMLPIADALMKLKREVETRVTSWRIAPEAARRSILMIGGQAGAGANFNVVPASCWFTVDRRINPEEDLAIEKQRLLSILEDAGAEVEVLQEGASSGVPEDGALAGALARNIERVTGRAPQFEMCPGLLETRFYAAQGIPAFAYGPGLLTVSHGPNEFVPVSRIVQCAQIYALTAADALDTGDGFLASNIVK
jgi:acetylornithine deacetylase/succinyl-diaminopimelate desuccinylase family protein